MESRKSAMRVQANHVAFGIMNERNETVLADGEFLFEDFAPVLRGPRRFFRAINASKVNNHGIAGGPAVTRHLDKRACASGQFAFHGESEHFNDGTIKGLKLDVQNVLVKALRPCQVINVDLKPANWISFRNHGTILLRSAGFCKKEDRDGPATKIAKVWNPAGLSKILWRPFSVIGFHYETPSR
jgi:hypothetical protein